MKTLDQIISRNDYVRVNNALISRSKELARKFADKFYQICGAWDSTEQDYPPYAITVNGREYCAKWNIFYNNGRPFTRGIRFVLVEKDGYFGKATPKSLCCTDYGEEASNRNYVDFLNDARQILDKLDEAESNLVAEAEAALEAAKEL